MSGQMFSENQSSTS